MRPEQYDTVVKLMRGKADSPANIAAKKVLVQGVKTPDAIHESGIGRDSVYKAIQRYSGAHERIVKVFQGGVTGAEFFDAVILGKKFDLIVDLNRGKADAPTTKAARAVIVDGMANSEIDRADITPQGLYEAVKRYRTALEDISRAYPSEDTDGKR